MRDKVIILAAVLGVLVSIVLILHKVPENGIRITHNLSGSVLREKNILSWYVWSKEPSEFYWQFTERETAYIIEGEVVLTPEGSTKSVLLKRGDLVVFEPGLRVHWRVTQPLRKHVTLEQNLAGKVYWRTVFMLKAIPRAFSPASRESKPTAV